jgi:hypothetical protein
VPLTPDHKKKLLIGGGIGALTLLGVALFKRRPADPDASPRSELPPAQLPVHRSQAPAPTRQKKLHRHDDRDDDHARGEYGRRRKHRRRRHGR